MIKIIDLVKVLVRYKDKYLLLKKAKDDFFPENIGRWECPGGIIGLRENSQDATIREVKEETGLECKLVKRLPTIRKSDEEIESNCEVYLLESTSDNVRLSDEHSDFSWVSPEHIKDFPLVKYANLLLRYFNNPEKYLK